MKLHNTLTKTVEEFKPLEGNKVLVYSCGPTVYDHIHIGNLSSFIYADTLVRALKASGYEVEHVMNFTDVDDKTIKRSAEKYPDLSPEEALKKLTGEYEQIFMSDMEAIGNDVSSIKFVRATDNIENMQKLITKLYKDGFAYVTDDGVYFSIEKYKQSGKKYGQLLEINSDNTSESRIQNDEYDKDFAHDFALWKLRKEGEPAWDFELEGHNLLGRPGWHIECSAMSTSNLGQPFDIHTGGVDLIFPHHENEIAQSTAGKDSDYAKFFVHNEHLLVDGKKMSKSLNNFFTLDDIKKKGFDPLAFRLMVLQSHYRSQSNFTWENLEAAWNRLKDLQAWADLDHQRSIITHGMNASSEDYLEDLEDDLRISNVLIHIEVNMHNAPNPDLLEKVDQLLGLELNNRADITDKQMDLMNERKKVRAQKDFAKSDKLRDQLKEQGIGVRDTDLGQVWFRL